MNPLLRRELAAIFRKRRAFWLLTTAVACCGLFPVLGWPESTATAASAQGSGAFLIFVYTQLTAALLLVTVFTAGSVAAEREQGTRDLLFGTLLSPRSIIFSKAAAPTLYALLLLIATAPSVCVLYLLGGTSFGGVLLCFGVTSAAVLTAVPVALFHSLKAATAGGAVARSLFWVAFWSSGPLIAILLPITLAVYAAGATVWEQRYPAGHRVASVVEAIGAAFGRMLVFLVFAAACLYAGFPFLMVLGPVTLLLSPFSAIYLLARPTHHFVSGAIFGTYVLFALVVSGGHWIRAVRSPRGRGAEGEVSSFPAVLQVQSSQPGAVSLTSGSLLSRLLIFLGERNVPLLRDPVLLRELRFDLAGSRACRATAFWLTLAGASIISIFWRQPLPAFAFAAALVVSLLVLPAAAATAFPREADRGSLDLLRGTLLSPAEVLRGKWLACFSIALETLLGALIWLPVTALLRMRYLHDRELSISLVLLEAAVGPAILLSTIALVGAFAVFISVVSRSTLQALLLTYVPLFCLLFGVPIGLRHVAQLESLAFLECVEPFSAMAAGMRAGHEPYPHGIAAFAAFVALYAGATLGLCRASFWWLARHRWRDR